MRAAYIDRPSPGAGKACLRRNICLELARPAPRNAFAVRCGGRNSGVLPKRLCSRGTGTFRMLRRHGRRERNQEENMDEKYLEALEFDKIRARAADGIVCPEARGMLLSLIHI